MSAIFLPRPWLKVENKSVLQDQPFTPDPASPHVCQFMYRRGGKIYVAGSIMPPDRRPIPLGYWHQVVMNGRH